MDTPEDRYAMIMVFVFLIGIGLCLCIPVVIDYGRINDARYDELV